MPPRTNEIITPQSGLSRRGLLRTGALAAAGAAFAGMPFGRQLLAHDVSQSWPNVAALVEKYVGGGRLPNLFLTFGWGQEDHAHTVGGGKLAFDSSVDVDENTLYRIYSMTKPITGICAMTLVADGTLGLDQTIHDVLPAWRDMMVQKDYDGAITEDNLEPAETPITIRHLLTHTAGIGYGIIQQGPISQAMNERGLIPGQVSRMPIPGIFQGDSVQSLEAYADGMAALPLVTQPGKKWIYSASLDILGRVIEVAAGKSFEEVMQERIFDPCGMTSTYWAVPQNEVHRFTTNYGILGETALPIDPAQASIYLDNPPFAAGGAGLVSSAKDYDRFLRMLLGEGKLGERRVLSAEAVRVGTSNLLPEGVQTEGTWVAGQGFGAGGRVVDGTFGWGGAAGTLAAVNMQAGLRACLFTQYMPADALPIRDEFLAAVAADMSAMTAVRDAV